MGEQSFSYEYQPGAKQPLETKLNQTITEEIARNNQIALKILTRDEWEKKDSIFGRATLYLPNDLHIWEIPGVVEAMGYPQTKEKIQDLGRVFQNTGVYLARRLHGIDEGRGIAQTKAEELYNFGESLILQKKLDKPKNIQDISKKILTYQETEEIDRFWISDQFYRANLNAALTEMRNNPDEPIALIHEKQRTKTLNHFFEALQKDSENKFLHRFETTSYTNQPSNLSPDMVFIQDTFKRKIAEPLTELTNAIIQHGTSQSTTELSPILIEMQEKVQQMFLNFGEDIEVNNLYHLLQIDRFKGQIESSKKNGQSTGRKEINLARYIQKVTSMVAYQEKKDAQKSKSPEEISVKATNIGVNLMQKAGLNPLVVSTSGYSTILLMTSDYKLKLMDMTTVTENRSITNDMLQGSTISNIFAFARNPESSGLKLTLNYNDLLSRLLHKKQRTETFTVYSPQQGQKISSLFNEAFSSYEQATKNKSLKATEKTELFQKSFTFFETMMESLPQDDNLWYNYGLTAVSYFNNNPSDISKTELLQKAQNAFNQAINLNPENDQAYLQLGKIFEIKLQKEKAIEAYKKALKINPKNKEARKRQHKIR